MPEDPTIPVVLTRKQMEQWGLDPETQARIERLAQTQELDKIRREGRIKTTLLKEQFWGGSLSRFTNGTGYISIPKEWMKAFNEEKIDSELYMLRDFDQLLVLISSDEIKGGKFPVFLLTPKGGAADGR